MNDINEHRNEEYLPNESQSVSGDVSAVKIWEQVNQLAELLAESDLSEIELKQDDRIIHLVRRRATAYPGMMNYPPVEEKPAIYPATGEKVEPTGHMEENLLQITAPMTGVFYSAPSPEEPPFIRPGDIVNPGDTVCLLEAMKIFNELTADVRGRVVQVIVNNGELVKNGQPLILLEPV
ncbi:MAG: acetyl-CoA carboxylase biotin carboxyl carrier protein [bacterium]